MKSFHVPLLLVLPVSGLLLCALPGGESREGRGGVPAEPGFERVREGVAVSDRASTGGVSWVHLDGDGDSDLFVTNGYDVSAETPVPQGNRVYLNQGDGTFASPAEGPLGTDEGFSSGSTWGDYDNDGDPDVFVTNQQDQDNVLYRNEGGGAFTRLEDSAPARDGGHSFAAAWVDVDGDGHLDLFVANGGLSHQGRNFLYRNEGEGSFARIEEGALVTAEGGTCGIAWGDYDGDGDLDLYVAAFYGLANALYRNEGSGRFHRVREGAAVLDGGHSYGLAWADRDNDGDLGRFLVHAASVAWGDADGDGDLDLYVGNWPNEPGAEEENHLYRNRHRGGHWLGVRLVGTRSNRSGIGAQISATVASGEGEHTMLRQISAHAGWRSQGPLVAHFGLGAAEEVRELVVRWPSGAVDRLAAVPADRVLTVSEGQTGD